jgi:hypothetical protein
VRDEQIDWNSIALIGSGVSSMVYRANVHSKTGTHPLALKVSEGAARMSTNETTTARAALLALSMF